MFDLIWFDECRHIDEKVLAALESIDVQSFPSSGLWLADQPEIPVPHSPPAPPAIGDAVWTHTRRRAYRNLKGRNRRAW
jgi:hypothetical protein